jgi:RNA polymerase sigma-70 factor, ECF subfamily
MILKSKTSAVILGKKTFESLFKNHYTPLCRFAYKYTSDQEVSREIVQELFISLWQNKDALQIHSSMESYLYASVRNRCLNHLKRQTFLKDTHKFIADSSETEYDNISDEINYKELQCAVQVGLGQLPDRCKEIFDLSRNGGFSCKEIAAKLNIAPKTVENQLGIALKKLRESLSEYF